MCDYSLENLKSSRAAAVGDKLVTHNFGAGTRGFAVPDSLETAVCLLPGTEISFPNELLITHRSFFGWPKRRVRHTTAIFRQINKPSPDTYPDAVEFPDGHTVCSQASLRDSVRAYYSYRRGPATSAEAEEQTRAA
jgi:hypothetical protein